MKILLSTIILYLIADWVVSSSINGLMSISSLLIRKIKEIFR